MPEEGESSAQQLLEVSMSEVEAPAEKRPLEKGDEARSPSKKRRVAGEEGPALERPGGGAGELRAVDEAATAPAGGEPAAVDATAAEGGLEFPIGSTVRVHSLQDAKNNGRTGQVLAWLPEKGRYQIEFPSGLTKNLKPENLAPAPAEVAALPSEEPAEMPVREIVVVSRREEEASLTMAALLSGGPVEDEEPPPPCEAPLQVPPPPVHAAPGKGQWPPAPARRAGGPQRAFQISKAMATILRHTATSLGVLVRPDGFCSAAELLELGALKGLGCTLQDLREAVAGNDKQRFEIAEEYGEVLVRATQGHSMKAVSDAELLRQLAVEDEDLPKVCLHGTYRRHLPSILEKGLLAGGGVSGRNHIHFTPFEPGDGRVISGLRAGCEVAVYVDLPRAIGEGVPFYLSRNQVVLSPGLSGALPSCYITGVKDVQTGEWLHGGAA